MSSHTKIERESYLSRGLQDQPSLNFDEQVKLSHAFGTWVEQRKLITMSTITVIYKKWIDRKLSYDLFDIFN